MIDHHTIDIRSDHLDWIRAFLHVDHDHPDGRDECPLCDQNIFAALVAHLRTTHAITAQESANVQP